MASALDVAERLRRKIEALKIDMSSNLSTSITISLGVGQHQAGESIDKFINRIDEALYRAKQEGRNKVIGSR